MPQCPLRKSGAFARESMNDARATRASGGADVAVGAGRTGVGAGAGTECAPAQPARRRATDNRKARMREGSVRRWLAADAREANFAKDGRSTRQRRAVSS